MTWVAVGEKMASKDFLLPVAYQKNLDPRVTIGYTGIEFTYHCNTPSLDTSCFQIVPYA